MKWTCTKECLQEHSIHVMQITLFPYIKCIWYVPWNVCKKNIKCLLFCSAHDISIHVLVAYFQWVTNTNSNVHVMSGYSLVIQGFDTKLWGLSPALHFSWIPLHVLLSRWEFDKCIRFFFIDMGLLCNILKMLIISINWKDILIIWAFLDDRFLVLIDWIFLSKWYLYESVNLVNWLVSIIAILGQHLFFFRFSLFVH